MGAPPYPRVASLKTSDAFRSHLRRAGTEREFGETLDPPASHVMLLIYGIVAVSILPTVLAPPPATARVLTLLFGAGLGGDYMIILLMATGLFGVRVVGVLAFGMAMRSRALIRSQAGPLFSGTR